MGIRTLHLRHCRCPTSCSAFRRGLAAGFGGKVSRRPLDEVLAELEAQDEAAREADKAARKAIREQKKRERKEDFQTRVDALKAKFHQE